MKNDSRGVESNVLYTIEQIIIDNNNLYLNPQDAPYSITQYSPLYYIICDQIFSIIGLKSGKNIYAIRIGARLISIILLIGILFYIIKIFQIVFERHEFNYSYILILVLLIIISTTPWFYISRPDALVTLSFIISTYFIIKGNHSRIRYFFFAGLVSIIAPFAKQNGFIIIPIITCFLAIKLRFKELIVYIISVSIGIFIFISLYYFLGYSTKYIFENIYIGIQNGVNTKAAIDYTYIPFLIKFGVIFISTILIYIIYFKKWKSLFHIQYLIFFTIINLLVSFIFALKYGSAINYFNDVIVFTIVLIGFSIKLIDLKYRNTLYIIIILFCLVLSIKNHYQYTKANYKSISDTKDEKSLDEVKNLILNEIDNFYFYTKIRRLNLEFPDNCILPQSEIIENSLKNKSKYYTYYQNIVKNIDHSKIKFVIIYSYSIPLLDQSFFRLYKTIGNIYIYINNDLYNENIVH